MMGLVVEGLANKEFKIELHRGNLPTPKKSWPARQRHDALRKGSFRRAVSPITSGAQA